MSDRVIPLDSNVFRLLNGNTGPFMEFKNGVTGYDGMILSGVKYNGRDNSGNYLDYAKDLYIVSNPGDTTSKSEHYYQYNNSLELGYSCSGVGINMEENDISNINSLLGPTGGALNIYSLNNNDIIFNTQGTQRIFIKDTGLLQADYGVKTSTIKDLYDSTGNTGQILSSTNTGIQWINASGGGGSTGLAGVLSISNNAGSTGINMNNQTITNTASIGNTGATLAFGSTVNANTTLTAGGTGTFVVTGSGIGKTQPIMRVRGNDNTGVTGIFLDLYNSGLTGGNLTGNIGAVSFTRTGVSNSDYTYSYIQGRSEIVGGDSDYGYLDFYASNIKDMEIGPNYVKIVNALQDGSSLAGNIGQVLKSTASNVSWSNNTGDGTGLVYYIKQSSNGSLTDNTSAQSLFKVTTTSGTGAIPLSVGIWDFDISAGITGCTATNNRTISFNFASSGGSGALNNGSSYNFIGYGTAGTAPAATSQIFRNGATNVTTANTVINAGTSITTYWFQIKGVLSIGTATTITPTITSVTVSPGASAVITAGSYVKFTNISTTATNVYYVG